MDRCRGLSAAVLCGLATACGASGPQVRALSAGEAATAAARGLRERTRAAEGVLTYAVALDGANSRLVSVELATNFELVVRDLDSGGRVTATRRLRLGPPDYDVFGLALSPRGELAWVASLDGTVRAVNLEDLAVPVTWRLGDGATAVAVTADGRFVATGSSSGVVCLRRTADNALVHCVAGHGAPVSALATSGDRLVSSSWDGTVISWTLPGLAVASEHRVDGSANDVSLSPDGARIAVAASRSPPLRSPAVVEREKAAAHRAPDPGAFVEIRGPSDRSLRLSGHGAAVSAVAWTADGSRIVSGSWDRTVRLWDSGSGDEIARFSGFSHIIRDVVAGRDGRWVAVGAWAVSDGQPSSMILELLYTIR